MSLSLCCFSTRVVAQTPDLKVRGENFGVLPLSKGQQPFFNRTNMSFDNIPQGYEGWKFTKMNANSAYIPGPLPTLEIKASSAGYLTVMVATYEKPAVCSQWAADNGWELIREPKLSYIVGDEGGVLSFFRKWVEAGTWINVVQPATFSGAIVVAPSIEEELSGEIVQAVPVKITSVGWMETDRFMYNALAYANRTYVFSSVPKAMTGLQFTRYRGGLPPVLKITAQETGDMYIAASHAETVYRPQDHGWTKVEGFNFSYNDPTGTTFSVYKKAVNEGDTMRIRTNSWQGILVFSPKIEYTNFLHLTPPPGVVIYNSKASSKKFVGSPSITVLEDGTYLASHDIFGVATSYSFVYKSTDKGKTWEKISEINPLTWSKLFTRGKDLFLIGVVSRCAMGYGNIVVLQSKDGGYTWTSPKDAKSGLLRTGYYHTAPTPVVFHEGKIWKAMENQGNSYGSWGPFSSFMMSIEEDADLLDATQWTFSNELAHAAGAVASTAWLEGNPVIGIDGSMKNILRLHYGKDDKAAIISVSEDGKTIAHNPQTDIANLPGACKKFTIQYDKVSKQYWTLSNYVLGKDREGNNLERVRNTIVLSYSDDLINWTIKDTLLHHSDIGHHGFQYLDWLFEGEDVIAVSRTSWEDETGNADSQHNANYLTFHRFPNFRYDRPAAAQGIAATRWYKNAESALALTFDDGFEAHSKYAFPLLKKYGLQGTFFVNSENLVKKGEAQKERYGYWEDFKEMSDDGQEIASHSLTHPNLTSLDYDILTDELEEDKARIEAGTGKPCLTHAYPFCLHDETVDQVAATAFIAARQCGEFSNGIPSSDEDWFSVHSELLTWIYPRSLENEEASFQTFKEKADGLNGKFGVACIHETLPFSMLHTSDTYEIATTEWLEKVCEYLSGQQSSGKIWATTFANIVRYAKERDNLRIYRQEFPSGAVQYDFTTWLDPSVYNVPLSIECAVPENWKRVRCQVKNGETVVSDSVYEAGSGKILLEVIPDQESLVLTDETDTSVSGVEVASPYTVYPNPVQDVLYVENINTDVYCEVFDTHGRILKIENIRANPGVIQLDMKNLQSGLYIVRFSLPDRTPLYSFRVMKE